MENMDYDGFLKLFEDRDRMYKECSKQEITIDNKDIAELANEIINYAVSYTHLRAHET